MDNTAMEVHKMPSLAQIHAAEDKYTASIELSNKCREFYKSRVEAAHCIKSRWEREAAHQSSLCNDNDRPAVDNADSSSSSSSSCCNSGTTTTTASTQRRKRSSIEEAMDKLRAEMSSLMDQDLSLMKQLLTLNETIEDLKWQRRYYTSPRSSADLDHDQDSDCSVSDTEMYESDDDLRLFSPSSLPASSFSSAAAAAATAIIPNTTSTTAGTASSTITGPSTSCRRHSVTSHKGEKWCPESSGVMVMAESPVKVYHGEQDSFDSGIHESCGSSSSGDEDTTVLEASV